MRSNGFEAEIGTEANPVQLSDAEEDALEALAERESRSHALNRKRKWAFGSSASPRRQRGQSSKFPNEKPLPPGAAVGWESEEEDSRADRGRSRAEVDVENEYAPPGFRAGEGHLEEEVAESTGREDGIGAANEEYEDSEEYGEGDDEDDSHNDDDDEDILMWEAGTSGIQGQVPRGSLDEEADGAHSESSYDSRDAHPPADMEEEEESVSSDIAVVEADEEDAVRRVWEAAAQRRRGIHNHISKKPEDHGGDEPRGSQTPSAKAGGERLRSIKDPLPQVDRAPVVSAVDDNHVRVQVNEQAKEEHFAGCEEPHKLVRPAVADPANVHSNGGERCQVEDRYPNGAGDQLAGVSSLHEELRERTNPGKGDQPYGNGDVLLDHGSNGTVLAGHDDRHGAEYSAVEDGILRDSKENGVDLNDGWKATLIGDRERLKSSADFIKADEEEWQRRQEELQRQALAVQLERKRRRKENEVNQRMQQRLQEVRSFQAAEEVKIATREDIKSRVRSELERKIEGCRCMGDVLHRLEIDVANWPNATLEQVRDAFRKALLQFHPDHASTAKGLDHKEQVHAEEKFKLITSMKNKLPWVFPPLRIF